MFVAYENNGCHDRDIYNSFLRSLERIPYGAQEYEYGSSPKKRIRPQSNGQFYCPKCGEFKQKSEFYIDLQKKDGIRSHCKKCSIAENMLYQNKTRVS